MRRDQRDVAQHVILVLAEQPAAISSVVELGTAFMREYLLPFELASVLLLVALIGAIVIAFEERSRRRKVLTLAEEFALRQQQAQAATTVPVTPEPSAE